MSDSTCATCVFSASRRALQFGGLARRGERRLVAAAHQGGHAQHGHHRQHGDDDEQDEDDEGKRFGHGVQSLTGARREGLPARLAKPAARTQSVAASTANVASQCSPM